MPSAAAVVADTNALLWMFDGTLPGRSAVGARHCGAALRAGALHVSVGTFLDLRYLVDSGRRPARLLDDARAALVGEGFTFVPLDLPVLDTMAAVPREQVADPFDRIIAATALHLDFPLVTSDEDIRAALGSRAIW